MGYCKSCEDLKGYAASFLIHGVTDEVCASLRKNTGLNPDLKVLHKNCEDLNDTLNCLLGTLREKLRTVNVCDIKKFVDEMMNNQFAFDKAMLCSHCGQWDEIERLWAEIKRIWNEIEKIWDEIERLAEQIRLLWFEIGKIWSEFAKVWDAIGHLRDDLIALDSKVNSIRDDLQGQIDKQQTLIENQQSQINDLQNQINAIRKLEC